MKKRAVIIAALLSLVGLSIAVPMPPAQAENGNGPYSIIAPEPGVHPALQPPGLPPVYQSPRGLPQHVRPPNITSVPPPNTQVPPPIYVPETGQLLPNLPRTTGAGPGGAETQQDRAVRCQGQVGAYGPRAGNSTAYIGSCLGQ